METIDAVLLNGDSRCTRRNPADILSLHLTHVQIHLLGAEYPEYALPKEDHHRFISQSSQEELLFHEGEEAVPVSVVSVPVPRSSSDYVEWLERYGCRIHQLLKKSTADCEDKVRREVETSARILMALAGELTYLRPGNRSHLGYDINMREWRVYWNELISEMKTLDTYTSSLGVYVLTTWPYCEFLKSLALRLRNQQIDVVSSHLDSMVNKTDRWDIKKGEDCGGSD